MSDADQHSSAGAGAAAAAAASSSGMGGGSSALSLAMEFVVVDAERRFEVNGKVQNLSYWVFKTLCRARLPEYLSPPPQPEEHAAAGGAAAGNEHAPRPVKHYVVGADGRHVDYCSFHRYSDFEWLRNRLKEAQPGLLLPPVPDKDSDGTMDKLEDLVSGKDHQKVSDNPLIAGRMRQLNLFMQALQPLLQLHTNEHLKAFVTLREPQWLEHKERTDKALKVPVTAKKVFSGMETFFKSIGKTKVPVFDEAHPVTKIGNRMREFGEAMLLCAKHLEQASKMAHAAWEPRPDDGSMSALARHPLPPALLFLSHRVSGREKQDGTIIHVDDGTGRVYVDWHDGSAPEPVPQNALSAPATGVVDPVCLLLSQVVSAIDSTVIELRARPEAGVLREAYDYCYFLHNWARAGLAIIEETAKVQEDYRTVTAEKQGASAADVPALEAQCQELDRKFNASKDAIVASFHTYFTPQQRLGVQRICRMAGQSVSNMLRSDDWIERMQAPAHLYECRFDEVHPAIAPLLKQQHEAAAARQAAVEAAVTMPAEQHAPAAAAAAAAAAQVSPAAGARPAVDESTHPLSVPNDSIARQGENLLAPPQD